MNRTAPVLGLTAAALALVFTPAGNAQSGDTYSLDKAEYLPGETITVSYDVTANCEGTVGSTGFVGHVAPEFQLDPPNIMRTKATAGNWAGEYRTSLKCGGEYVSKSFRVLEQAKAPEAPAPVQKPKAPIVKPKGAPQTGGGGTV
ncbi:hypothetical protein BBK82_18845 [Lentzea guizhouensis]|uniref:Serine/threonine protein kinase n=1 Tax=Lentzea guizhouensis TaxID=1586287 RepID=A0A1B2HJB8_9PSEU|nr:hypothetical protein [Lentzea guizhouensis]ANZ37813.1 hypothetical protein BBK82_18845 [Lentzea guizhouensis]